MRSKLPRRCRPRWAGGLALFAGPHLRELSGAGAAGLEYTAGGWSGSFAPTESRFEVLAYARYRGQFIARGPGSQHGGATRSQRLLSKTLGLGVLPRVGPGGGRSEERRVGKECRSRWSP